MAKTSRQTAIFGVEDWKRIYKTYREADFQSYDFETLRKSFVDYIRLYYPESYNDYIQSSEFVALLDLMAFMGQSLSFRNDLNTRENFIDTAERRDSVVRLANLIGYTPKRNQEAKGFLKVTSVSTTENVIDYNGINLSNVLVNWNDPVNTSWLEQFTVIVNAAMVTSQRFGRPGATKDVLGTQTDEYTLRLIDGLLPVVPFTSTVNNTNMTFEAVSATTENSLNVYEPSPRPDGQFNFLYRNDKQGYASPNTGFFFFFKQGSLQAQNFSLTERISNRTVNVNIEGINNDDVWLYKLGENNRVEEEWTKVDNIYAGGVNQTASDQRNFFSITSRANDQINLNFGDGVFSTIPVGNFRAYVRASNGLDYIINTQDMQNISLSFTYVSKRGRNETITFTCQLSQPVSNASARENIEDIKTRAPARYYTQNRMVNGEDYNNLPYTLYGSVIKSKAVNRSSIGTSRYLDLVDITGKYSSTNIFASDGLIYEQTVSPSFTFSFVDTNDIDNTIQNQLEPAIAERGMLEFYFENFLRPSLSVINIDWIQSTSQNNVTTGYFRFTSAGEPAPIGASTSDNKKYIVKNALVKFEPPSSGYYFDSNNRLKIGSPTLPDDKTYIWATVVNLVLDGTNFGTGNLSDGSGPVSLNNFIPSEAVPTEVIPVFKSDLPTTLEQTITSQVQLYKDFGLGFDNETGEWYLITSSNLNPASTFSFDFAKNTGGNGLDNSWLVKFVTDGETYTVTSRGLQRFFGSLLETRFFYDGTQQVFDPKTGTVINDFIKILKTNSKPDSSEALNSDEKLDIIAQPVESDGFVDDFRVRISFGDVDNDNVPDDPDYFKNLVDPSTNPNNKLVFLQRTTDFDNLERYLPLAKNVVQTSLATLEDIELAKSEYQNEQIFYATSDKKFYQLAVTASGTRTIAEITGYEVFTGRQDLYFQYRHNSPLSRRIDPGTSNIIDVYLVTNDYYTAYQKYVTDNTNTVAEPNAPTINQLTTDYASINDYKMISDNVILNSVKFKPLFGPKANVELRSTIKVIKNSNSTASVSEIKSRTINAMNTYFEIDKWNFGDTFFFSELSAYLHEQLGDIVSSVVLVPVDPLKSFGDLYEIRSEPNEIFVNAATVNDIEVISALTSSQLRTASNSGVQ